jgi:hypothetical protein
MNLNDVQKADLPAFFEMEQDREAIFMAAFTAEDPTDRAAFDAHWQKVLADETIIKKTIRVEMKSLATSAVS